MVFQTDCLPYDLNLIPDESVWHVGNMLDELDLSLESQRDLLFAKLSEKSIDVMDCPNCDRYHIETGIKTGAFNSFIREFPDPTD